MGGTSIGGTSMGLPAQSDEPLDSRWHHSAAPPAISAVLKQLCQAELIHGGMLVGAAASGSAGNGSGGGGCLLLVTRAPYARAAVEASAIAAAAAAGQTLESFSVLEWDVDEAGLTVGVEDGANADGDELDEERGGSGALIGSSSSDNSEQPQPGSKAWGKRKMPVGADVAGGETDEVLQARIDEHEWAVALQVVEEADRAAKGDEAERDDLAEDEELSEEELSEEEGSKESGESESDSDDEAEHQEHQIEALSQYYEREHFIPLREELSKLRETVSDPSLTGLDWTRLDVTGLDLT